MGLYHIFALDYCQICTNLFHLLLFSVLSLEKSTQDLYGRDTDNSRRGAAPVPIPVFVVFLLAAQTRWISQFLRYICFCATNCTE